MMRSAIRCTSAMSVAPALMTANSSPPSRPTRSSGRSRPGQARRDVADQFVADRMTERVVDVLEMVEVDVEYRGRGAAVPNILDHLFEPLAEEIAVGQAAERIVQGKIAQALFALRDGRGGAAHVAMDERGQQREARKRHRDEGDDAGDDLGAGLLRRPGETHDGMSGRILQLVGIFRGRRERCSVMCKFCSCTRAAMSASTPSSMNFTAITIGAVARDVGICDLFARRDQRPRRPSPAGRESAAPGRRGCGGPAALARRGSEMRTAWFGCVAGAAAHVVEGRRQFRDDGIEPARLDAVAAEQGVGQAGPSRRRRRRNRGRNNSSATGRCDCAPSRDRTGRGCGAPPLRSRLTLSSSRRMRSP